MRRIFLILLFLLTTYSAFAQTQDQIPNVRLGELRSGARSLVVGGVSDFYPYNIVGPNGELIGVDRDVIRAIAERIGIRRVEFKTLSSSELEDALLSGKIDVIANSYWSTPERQRQYQLTIPYSTRGGLGAMFPKDSNIRGVADFAGKRIVVFHGSYGEQWTRDNVANATIIPVDGTMGELEHKLADNEVDILIGPYMRKRDAIFRDLNGAYQSMLLRPMPAVFAVRRNDVQLRDLLDQGLKAIWSDGTLTQIKKNYLDPLGIEPARKP